MRATALAALLAVSMNACGGTTTSGQEQDRPGATTEGLDPLEWAAAVCTSIGRWDDALVPLRFAAAGDDPATTRDSLVAALDDALGATTTLLDELGAVGSPAINGGDAAARELRRAFAPIPDVLRGAVDDARSLPVDDPFAFAAARDELARGVADQLGALTTRLGEAAAAAPSRDLDEAFATLLGC